MYDGRLGEVGDLLRKIPRFSFDGAAMLAAHQVSRSRPSSILSVIRFFRLPFDAIWMEWAGDIPGVELDTNFPEREFERTAPRRMGVLARNSRSTTDDIDLYFFWSHRHEIEKIGIPSVNPSLFACSLNRAAHSPNISSDCFTHAARILGSLKNNARELEALAELIARFSIFIPYHMEGFHRKSILHTSRKESFEAACKRDLAGEPPLTVAAICLLNTKNLVKIENINLSSLNRARERRGNPPLLDYNEVSISLSKTSRNRALASGITGVDLKKHLVRGHFKLRETGIFWWRSFVRGNVGKPSIPQKYVVDA